MKVRCINNKLCHKEITIGKAYEVLISTDDRYFIICDYGKETGILKNRFEVVKDDDSNG